MSISASEEEEWAESERDLSDSEGPSDLQEELIRVMNKAVQAGARLESSRRAGQEQTRFLVLQVQPPSSRNDRQRCRFFPTSTISLLRRGLRPNRHVSTQQHRPCFLRWTGRKPTGMCVWPPIEETVAAHLHRPKPWAWISAYPPNHAG